MSNTASLLKIGATGRATSDLSNGSFAIRLRAQAAGPRARWRLRARR